MAPCARVWLRNLGQSPFFSIISDERVEQTLLQMGKLSDVRITPQIAREICQRTQSAAVLDGSIAQVGTQYSVILRAINCATGEMVANTQAQSGDKSHVLDALGKAATNIREKLGESLSTLQKFNTPLEEATTPSLEALQAYSLGVKTLVGGDNAGAVPLFQRAVLLDPNFAAAHALLGRSLALQGELNLGAENMRKAYELRDRVSTSERFFIESSYHQFATGDLEKARQSLEFWAQTYPRESAPRIQLTLVQFALGQYEKSLAQQREALRLDPSPLIHANIVILDIALNRFEEVRTSAEDMQEKISTLRPYISFVPASLRTEGRPGNGTTGGLGYGAAGHGR